MKQTLFLLLLAACIASCSRYRYSQFRYDTVEVEYDLERAMSIWEGLKDGYLIVQIPTYGQKEKLLKSLATTTKDERKRSEFQKAYETAVVELGNSQIELFKGIEQHYSFSKYAFIPDTLIHEFRQGGRKNVLINSNHDFVDIDIPSDATILILRDRRDFDDLNLFNLDGTTLPRPFPFTTTVSTLDSSLWSSYFKSFGNLESSSINAAIYVLDQKLKGFYNDYRSRLTQ